MSLVLLKGGLGLWIGSFALPFKGRKLHLATEPYRFDQVRIGVADEIEKGRRFSVLLAHEQQGNAR